MTQLQVNVIGAIILISWFFYKMIWKPKQLMKKPSDVQPVIKQTKNLKLSEIIYTHFSEDFYVVTQQPLNMLIHSSKLSRNTDFAKELQRLEADAVLVDKENRMPVAAVMLSTKDDERKGALISGIGVGCLIFSHVDDEEEIVSCIQQYLVEQEHRRILAEAL
ncbi:hypothetical protein EHW64_18020 [Erwinia psidii]|uniref:hypothetical protein n=1 Tax=Erwinia psidii TaxID=69224 RepID=UPI00226B87F9|nr:hypothetical protein [Erwinia psidii]MCX8959312.1 hypothetical protein [Erwinia psidii]MCX8962961.1 hypothetical protein [Erwinia psidii]